MASFWENFAEAMGWGKANHTKHFSEISDEDKKRYSDRYADSAIKAGEKESSSLKIENAKNKGGDLFTPEDDPFVGDYASKNDGTYETRVYDFEYDAPASGTDMDKWDPADIVRRSGKVLVRVPKATEPGASWGDSPYFDENSFRGNKFGVYEAVLDDGTILDGDQFKDLVYANPYDRHGSKNGIGITFGKQAFTNSKDKLKDFKKYAESLNDKQYTKEWEKRYPTKWDANWRRFMTTTKPSKDLYQNSPSTYTFYFKPGPNGE